MSFANFDDDSGWAAVSQPPIRDIVKDALKKEEVVKEIAAAQDDLRVLLGKIRSTEADVDKLTAGNATLQMYIDNMTKQIARR